MLGLLIAICCSLIILFGPFIRAVEDRDYHELIVDLIILMSIWFFYFVGSGWVLRLIVKAIG